MASDDRKEAVPAQLDANGQMQPTQLQAGSPTADDSNDPAAAAPPHRSRQQRRRRQDFVSFRFPWDWASITGGAGPGPVADSSEPEPDLQDLSSPRPGEVYCGPRVHLKLASKGEAVEAHLSPPVALRKGYRVLVEEDERVAARAVARSAGCPEPSAVLLPLLDLAAAAAAAADVHSASDVPAADAASSAGPSCATLPAAAAAVSTGKDSSVRPPSLFKFACSHMMRSRHSASLRGVSEPGDRVLCSLRAVGPQEACDLQLCGDNAPDPGHHRQQMAEAALQGCNTWLR